MLNYTAQDQFTDAQIYDLSDLVKGGLAGASNLPIEALLDRTVYLLNRLMSYEAVAPLPGSYTYDVADKRKLFVFNLSNNASFTLPDVGSLRPGSIIPINCYTTGIKALTVQCFGTQKIKGGYFDGSDTSFMWMHNNEKLKLVAAGDHWEVDPGSIGNFFSVGESVYSRRIIGNCIGTNGTFINRADMPRLTAYALTLGSGQGIVSDSAWLSDPNGPVYRSCFSYGNDSTTLRLPDERGLFVRALDQGRGLDNSRIHNYVGGFELDSNAKHNHTDTADTTVEAAVNGLGSSNSSYVFPKITNGVPEGKPGLVRRSYKSGVSNGQTVRDLDNGGAGFEPMIGETIVNIPFQGGDQTQPKNFGLLNQIRY